MQPPPRSFVISTGTRGKARALTSASPLHECSPSRWSDWSACAGAGVMTAPTRDGDYDGSFVTLIRQPANCAASTTAAPHFDAGGGVGLMTLSCLWISVARWRLGWKNGGDRPSPPGQTPKSGTSSGSRHLALGRPRSCHRPPGTASRCDVRPPTTPASFGPC